MGRRLSRMLDWEEKMKTIKFNKMISAFQGDFTLAKSGKHKLAELDTMIDTGNQKLINDIKLLEELEFLLRTGKAEIHLVDN